MRHCVRAAGQLVKELNYILDTRQKKRALYVLIVIVIGSFFELIGVSAILPFVQAIINPTEMVENSMVKKVVDVFGINPSPKTIVLILGIGMILIYIIKNMYMIFSAFIQSSYSSSVQQELSDTMLCTYMRRPYSFFLDINSAEVIRGCLDNVTGIYNIISCVQTLIAEVLTTILLGGYVIIADPGMALAAVLLIALLTISVTAIFRPIMKRAGQQNRLVIEAKSKAIYQAVTGIKEILVMQRQKYFEKQYKTVNEKARIIQRNYGFINACPDRILEGICMSGLIAIVCIRFLVDEDILNFIPKLAAFAMASFKILPAGGKISNRINSIIYYQPLLKDAYINMREVNAFRKNMLVSEQKEKVSEVEKATVDFNNVLEIRNIEWKYNGQPKEVLLDAAMTVKKGEAIGIIGTSGAGKSTLMDIMLGLLRPQNGMVEMDGIDISTIPEKWAQLIGYVPQSIFVMDDTIRNNIAFGLEGNDEKVWEALERAQLKEYVSELPQKLDTIVGERGIKFSGGQRQRLAIARALYCNPQILILDEATAALDNETEAAVMQAIDLLQGHITMIIVAHRLSTIKKCDAIYEVKEGKIIWRSKEEVFGSI